MTHIATKRKNEKRSNLRIGLRVVGRKCAHGEAKKTLRRECSAARGQLCPIRRASQCECICVECVSESAVESMCESECECSTEVIAIKHMPAKKK